jgi:hypothetical protein
MLTALLLGMLITAAFRLASTSARKRDTHSQPDEPPPPEPRIVALATAKEGDLVKLVGRVKLTGDSMVSPVTGRPCVACLVRAQVWHSRKIPQLIDDLRDARLTPFVLEVEGGEVVVEGAIVIEMRTARVTPKQEDARALLATHKLERFLDSSDFEETLIQAGDRIAVTGVLARTQEPAGYREVPVERMRFVPHPRLPVTLAGP